MIIERTNDEDLIKSVMLTPDLWEKLRIDGVEKSDLEQAHLRPNRLYLAGYEYGQLVGVQWFTPIDIDTVEYHPMVLKNMRIFSRTFIDLGIHWLFTHTNFEKIMVLIPSYVMTTFNFAKNQGFTHVKTIDNFGERDGKSYDLYELEMKKAEFH